MRMLRRKRRNRLGHIIMTKHVVLVSHWLPDGELARWRREFADIELVEANAPGAIERADIAYGLPDLARLPAAKKLRWIQLASAGVPAALCGVAKDQGIRITNLSGLYGPTIAEHALAMLLVLNRNLHVAERNQAATAWDRSVAATMRDLHGKTLAVVGLGDIGCNVARLAKAFGMRVVGCKRIAVPCPWADRLYPVSQLREMFAEADHVAVAAPLTKSTEGMVGPEALGSLKRGAILVNVSRGPIVQEQALIEALQSGHLRGAGLDVFAVEPLPKDHAFWTMPNVVVSPHYSGETVNTSVQPARRFLRNLYALHDGTLQEGLVNLEEGY
jgi:D-2-hydroxyacid dehydrogenase (NADP+)